ncbi:DUF421 domain-containing protein [Paenibacillus wynnii]|uniref:DUF421 domain-containing protein n=1 Tax=Paenibacillus wynnii TaxID=268407 RepID=UPI0027908042|nr:DUF421 domain-containing protein [Paenibacillus wynnii]MDQ0196622.1 uncharacterized membrane protein YcaP (DUF421 family) [Paenibacillus wynnii]
MNFREILDEVWKSFVVIITGMLLLRLAGRKSISQMTVPTTVIMVSIGTVIVQPIANKSIWMAIIAATTFIFILVLVEFLQIKSNGIEKFIRGSSVIVIKNGELQVEELKKHRLTVDQLEMKLRQNGITHIKDLKTVTIETNGHIGYELLDHAKPITIQQMTLLLDSYFRTSPRTNSFPEIDVSTNKEDPSLFDELHEEQKHSVEEELQ